RRCGLISWETLRIRLVFRQPLDVAQGRRSVIQSLPENEFVILKDTMRSLARMLAARRCRREKCCVQLFECWLPISETGSEVANCIYHRHSIATLCQVRQGALFRGSAW